MDDLVRRAGQFARGSVQRWVHDQEDYSYQEGFTEAADITLRRMQEKLDAFKEQMKGHGLSQAEQAIYAQLDELKSEIEAGFDRSGVDWRPPPSVAKRVVKQTDEPHS